jgi:phospholipid/cholesterol/gamma-HCH transport system permease protein
MSSASNILRAPGLLGPVAWVGRSVIAGMSYVGGVVLLTGSAAVALMRSDREGTPISVAFGRTLVRQLSWMLAFGIPLVGLVHIAMGSFLSLQAYYGSTFVDGTGAVVGVGLLRNLGGLMTGMVLSGLLAARMIPELSFLARTLGVGEFGGSMDQKPPILASRLAAPRILAAAIACVFLSQWGIVVGTVVGWKASGSMMGLPTETFFLMMVRMVWLRDVVGLFVKGLLFGILPAAICCFEAFREGAREPEPVPDAGLILADAGSPLAAPVLRATCFGIVAILIVNSSWFILVYHAVPFYGPTLLKPPGL